MAIVLPGAEGKRVLARVISLPSDGRPEVNDVKVEKGSYFGAGDDDAVLVEKSFAEYHGLEPGDTLLLRIEDREIGFDIAGTITSPEYIWPAKSRQEILVSPEAFGVVFVPEEAVPRLVGGPFTNEFAVTVVEGADREAAIRAATTVLMPYVIMDVVPSEEQPSNIAVSMDLEEFREFSEVFPLLFLIVGALATYIFLTRIVHNQRGQIGLMRAIGYSRGQVLRHYLGYALIIGIVGAVAGAIAGYLLSEVVTTFYAGILGLPYAEMHVRWLAIAAGIVLGIIPCVIAGLIPARAASRLSPAEAMRTPAPSAGRRLLLERAFPCLRRLSSLWKIPLRNVFRNRRRSLYTVIGVAFGISLILVSAAFIDSIGYFLDLQFGRIQRYDALVNFSPTQPQLWSTSPRPSLSRPPWPSRSSPGRRLRAPSPSCRSPSGCCAGTKATRRCWSGSPPTASSMACTPPLGTVWRSAIGGSFWAAPCGTRWTRTWATSSPSPHRMT